MSEEEKNVLETFKKGYGLTEAEQKILLNLIEKQQEKIKELTAFYNSFESGEIVNYPMFKQRYISKDKIREKIKELEDEKRKCRLTIMKEKCEIKILVLEGLLEEE